MVYQDALENLVRDVNLWSFGIALNHADAGNIDKMISKLEKADLQTLSFTDEEKQIIPVFLIALINGAASALNDVQNGSWNAADQDVLLKALTWVQKNPEAFKSFIKEVENLRAATE